MDRAVILRRVSLEEQRTGGYSLDTQESDLRKHCGSNGYAVVDDVEEVDSGDLLDERDGLWKVRQLMRHKAFEVLTVWKYDRLSRNVRNQAVLFYEAEKYGVRVESYNEPLDAEDPMSVVTRTLITFVAEQERRNIMLRGNAGKRNRALRGVLIPGSKPPYGYVWGDPDRKQKTFLILNLEEAETVRWIFDYLKNDGSLRGCARELTKRGVTTAKGGVWDQRTIKYIISNPVYWGEGLSYRWGKRKERVQDPLSGRVQLRISNVPHPESYRIALNDGVAPAIVDKATAEIVLSKLGDRRRLPDGNNYHPEKFLLRRGHVLCGHCNSPMFCRRRVPTAKTPTGSTTYACHNCFFSVSGKRLDRYVWDKVANNVLKHTEFVHGALDEFTHVAASPVENSIEAWTAELEAIKSERAGIALKIGLADPDLTKLLLTRSKELQDQEESIHVRRNKALAEYVDWAVVHDKVDALFDLVDAGNVDSFDHEHQRLALYVLGIYVVVRRKSDPGDRRWTTYMDPFKNRGRVEKNSTIVFPLPIDLLEPLGEILRRTAGITASTPPTTPTTPAQPTTPLPQTPQTPHQP